MTKYYGFFATAEGTRNQTGYEFTSIRKAAKDMRAIAHGNRLAGSTAKWHIQDQDGNILKSGTIK
jgi:hypothetical protein